MEALWNLIAVGRKYAPIYRLTLLLETMLLALDRQKCSERFPKLLSSSSLCLQLVQSYILSTYLFCIHTDVIKWFSLHFNGVETNGIAFVWLSI